VDVYSPPYIEDITLQLPRDPSHPQYRMRPSLAGLDLLAVHYDAEKVHWPYDPVERYKRQARFHMSKDWDPGPGISRGFGLMYHYRISPDGRIWRTQPELLNLWNANNANSRVLAVCVDLGPGQEPTYVQLVSMQAFADWICYHRPDLPRIVRRRVFGHGELTEFGNDTSCPGLAKRYVQRYRAGGVFAEIPRPVPGVPPIAVDLGRRFAETGYSVANPILKYFDENGGVATFGYPISARRAEKLEDGKTYTVQYFQKARLELHPEIAPDAVLRGNIGVELLALRLKG
jgi:hypothetical protein